MKAITAVLTAAAILTAPTAALAQPQGCPPGLAKKSPSCVPPGQAKKMYRDDDRRDRYRAGDVFRGDYVVIRDYDRYGLNRPGDRYAYWGSGDRIYRVDPDTQKIIDIIRLANAVFN
ncbi:hypothetical protein SAMN04490244_104234 [Tranquillimonas rosea]|uniref:Excinuclease ABC subunit A n=1 Tax=Tranquillimonas rosea TaxID=641238 RepID=A0A1H9TK11_9RHOB|nr:hypothetical protein [Tranquillimonas rosea]SER97575.1 hypothetical protein SAMN04490244_104234 [Tranquillimonas rosea]